MVNPRGAYEYRATSEARALDAFHAEVPIGRLDDFVITVTRLTHTDGYTLTAIAFRHSRYAIPPSKKLIFAR